MKEAVETRIRRTAHWAYRLMEIAVGVLAAAGSAMSLLMAGGIVVVLARGQASGIDTKWKVLILLISIPLGVCCAQIAWRLWTGRGRARSGALLSPTMMVLSGAGLMAFLGALLLSSPGPSPVTAAMLLATSLALFGMAAAQRRAERKGRRH